MPETTIPLNRSGIHQGAVSPNTNGFTDFFVAFKNIQDCNFSTQELKSEIVLYKTAYKRTSVCRKLCLINNILLLTCNKKKIQLLEIK